MRIMKIFLVSIITSTISHASLRDLNYDDVRKEGGFFSKSMINVCRIEATSTQLTENEKNDLLNSPYLSHIHTLDLSGQNINDFFVKNLANNQSLGRLMNVDLSNNPDITDAALEYIRDSLIFGSVRDLPQVSARYGGPSTTVRVKCKNTSIKKTNVDPKFYFNIDYIHPITDQQTNEPTDRGIKLIEVE